MASEFGLQILDLTWEDTGRYKGSSVGPNISDMTIQVGQELTRGEFKTTCMPVIRFPNFSDKSCDLDPRDFTLLAGNQKGGGLKRISLRDFLEDPGSFLSNPDSWKAKDGKRRTLLAERDIKVLVSAQACFLPIPKEGKATFNPVLFNYQSVKGDPAVLTILATREGTSVTVIDNVRDAFRTGAVWGQRLFFNNNGQRASLLHFGDPSLTGLRKNRARALTVAVPFPEQCVFARVYRTRDTRPNRIRGILSQTLTLGVRSGADGLGRRRAEKTKAGTRAGGCCRG